MQTNHNVNSITAGKTRPNAMQFDQKQIPKRGNTKLAKIIKLLPQLIQNNAIIQLPEV